MHLSIIQLVHRPHMLLMCRIMKIKWLGMGSGHNIYLQFSETRSNCTEKYCKGGEENTAGYAKTGSKCLLDEVVALVILHMKTSVLSLNAEWN